MFNICLQITKLKRQIFQVNFLFDNKVGLHDNEYLYRYLYVCMYVLNAKNSWVFLNNEQIVTKICVNGNCALHGYYPASSGNSLPRFRVSISVPTSRFKNSYWKPVILLCYLYREGCGRGKFLDIIIFSVTPTTWPQISC
jgi:hypothetical protein